MAKITYQDKAFLNENSQIADINKVTDADLNQIKDVINENDTNVGELNDLNTTDKTSLVNATNELLTNFNSLFKFQIVNQQVTIAGNGNIGTPIANLNIPDGYSFLGILTQENGYADQWQVTYARYQGNLIYAYIKSYYAQQLTSTLRCTVVYIKSDYLSSNYLNDLEV